MLSLPPSHPAPFNPYTSRHCLRHCVCVCSHFPFLWCHSTEGRKVILKWLPLCSHLLFLNTVLTAQRRSQTCLHTLTEVLGCDEGRRGGMLCNDAHWTHLSVDVGPL